MFNKLNNSENYYSWLMPAIDKLGSDPWFVTLTMKQGVELPDGRWERLTPESASQNLEWSLRTLNRAIFNNAAKRYGKKLIVIPVLHGNGELEIRHHYHVTIAKPQRLSDNEFRSLIVATWLKSKWGYKQVTCERAQSTGAVLHYMLGTGAEALDLNNTTL